MSVTDTIFKAYDIRGVYPDELDEEVAEKVGYALAGQLGARRLAVGMDPRPSSTGLLEAVAAGARATGADCVDIGLVPTEMLYYGVAAHGLDGGVMVTASHNPPQYNGLKMVGRGGLPLSGEQGIPELRERVTGLDAVPEDGRGGYERRDLYPEYTDHLRRLVDVARLPDLRVVMDAANGVAGKLVPRLFEGSPVERVELSFEVDGTFPNHEPNPLLPENIAELRARVLAEGADLGVAWDGDADRCLLVDEAGEAVPGDFVTALLAEALLRRHPGARILYDVRASRAVPDVIRENGGVPLVNRVGHAFFKQRMRREDILFGGEVSGHYYFRDNHNADSGFLPALLIMELLGERRATLGELLAPLRSRYFISGEINSVVDDVPAALARLRERYADGEVSTLDGVSVDYEHWHFNVRPSNTEPLLRLNLEADSRELMEEKRDEVLAVIRGG